MSTRQVHLIDHPLVQHKLTLMRNKDTSTAQFRRLLREISTLLCYEVTRDLPLEDYPVETPVGPTTGQRIAGKMARLGGWAFRPGDRLISLSDEAADILGVAPIHHVAPLRALRACAGEFRAHDGTDVRARRQVARAHEFFRQLAE